VTTEARFDALFRAHHAPILRYLQRRADPDDAADVAAEVFLTAWRRLADIPEDAPLLWLYGVARRAPANHRRGVRRRDALAGELGAALRAATPTQDVEPPVMEVRAALASLSPQERELLMLSAWEDLRPDEIATVLGIRPGAARVRLHRARARLRAALDNRPAGPPGPAPDLATPLGHRR
jgi:RNA polymerase sigma-70 factor (ECF subfamily)